MRIRHLVRGGNESAKILQDEEFGQPRGLSENSRTKDTCQERSKAGADKAVTAVQVKTTLLATTLCKVANTIHESLGKLQSKLTWHNYGGFEKESGASNLS